MILESIEATHIGPFTSSVTMGPLDPGLNILSDLNEAGKTTLLNAAVRALFDRHTTKDAKIKALQPAGTGLAPRVSVVFSDGTSRYKIEKTFLHNPGSTLYVRQDEAWRPVQEGDAADNEMRSKLQSSWPGRGATGAANWGLLRYLWARQGEEAHWPDWDDEAGNRIRHTLAKVDIDPFVESVSARLRKTHEAVFTPTGHVKAGGRLKDAQDALDVLNENLARIALKKSEIESLSERYRTLNDRQRLLAKEVEEKRFEALRTQEQAGQTEVLDQKIAKLEDRFEQCKSRLQTVTADTEKQGQWQQELTRHREEVKQAEDSTGRRQLDVTSGKQQLDAAEAERESTELVLRDLRALEQRIRDQLDLRQIELELERWRKVQQRASKQQEEIDRLESKQEKIPDITKGQLDKLNRREQSVREKSIQLEALGLRVELRPDRDTSVEVEVAGHKEKIQLRKNMPLERTTPQAIDLRLEEWGHVSIRSGAREIRDLQADLEKDKTKIIKDMADLGVANLDEAVQAVEGRKDINIQLKAAKKAIQAMLDEGATLDELNKKINDHGTKAQAKRKVLGLCKEETVRSSADLQSELETLRVRLKSTGSDRDKQERAIKKLKQQYDHAVSDLQEQEKQMVELRARERHVNHQLTELADRYPNGLKEAKEEAQGAFVQAEARLAEAKKERPSDFDKLPDRSKRAAAAAAQAEEDLKRIQAERNVVKGSLETLGAEGLYSQETELEEKKAILEEQANQARFRGQAAKLLSGLIDQRRTEATRSVVGPLEERLSDSFAEITGTSSRRVFLDDQLHIEGVGPSRDSMHAFALLSQGAKEQLLLCLRLAVAAELSQTEPQTLVLDDVLVNTDPVRQQRVLDAVSRAATHHQILILTCHPDRYRGVGKHIEIRNVEER